MPSNYQYSLDTWIIVLKLQFHFKPVIKAIKLSAGCNKNINKNCDLTQIELETLADV